MSYCKININGREYGLKFTNMSLEIYASKLIQGSNISQLCATIWAGLCTNAYRKNEDVELKFEAVCDWVEAEIKKDATCPQIVEAVKTFESIIEKPTEDSEKKNIPATNIGVTDENLHLVD